MYSFSKPWHENINMGEQWTSNLGTVYLNMLNVHEQKEQNGMTMWSSLFQFHSKSG